MAWNRCYTISIISIDMKDESKPKKIVAPADFVSEILELEVFS
jgi:hypothetical protein